jgi:precorrin-6B methylase 2
LRKPADVTRFGAIDVTDDPEYFVRFLAAGAANVGSLEIRKAVLEALRVREGQTILDVGCGLGADLMKLAAMVGPQGQTVGIDVSEIMIQKARDASG